MWFTARARLKKSREKTGNLLLTPTQLRRVLSSNNLSGKLVIDCTNPITPSFDLAVGTNTSGGETVARLAKGARVVKAFNTTGFGNMRHPKFGAVNLTMLYAGDDEAAKGVRYSPSIQIRTESTEKQCRTNISPSSSVVPYRLPC